ncbi:hypothetical protein IWX90DRAFT_159908 [Phyllosticta citrichinensis]|uniref:Secreted protein n=1 Tax=Phyllosticta citrichinensis TaxID=1130410 RepID=A0ABR1Y0W3_9PEZI
MPMRGCYVAMALWAAIVTARLLCRPWTTGLTRVVKWDISQYLTILVLSPHSLFTISREPLKRLFEENHGESWQVSHRHRIERHRLQASHVCLGVNGRGEVCKDRSLRRRVGL